MKPSEITLIKMAFVACSIGTALAPDSGMAQEERYNCKNCGLGGFRRDIPETDCTQQVKVGLKEYCVRADGHLVPRDDILGKDQPSSITSKKEVHEGRSSGAECESKTKK